MHLFNGLLFNVFSDFSAHETLKKIYFQEISVDKKLPKV